MYFKIGIFGNFRRSLREDAVIDSRIWWYERGYPRSYHQIRLLSWQSLEN